MRQHERTIIRIADAAGILRVKQAEAFLNRGGDLATRRYASDRKLQGSGGFTALCIPDEARVQQHHTGI